MLNHPDKEIQYIFTSLESQRDNLMIENANLSKKVAELQDALVAAAQYQQPEPVPTPVPENAPEAA